jgi:DNA-directed RNA polymerase subunit RPC12/RpoP
MRSGHFKRASSTAAPGRAITFNMRGAGSRMTFPFTCSGCGHVNDFGWSQIGQTIRCVGCEKTMTVPVPTDAVGPATSPPRATTFRCPSCRRKFAIKPELAGKKIRCSGCGAGVRVPGSEQESLSPTSRTGKSAHPRSDHADPTRRPARVLPAPTDAREAAGEGVTRPSPLLDELGWVETAKRPRRAEPVLPSRSELIEQVRQQAAEEEANETKIRNEKTKKKKKKKKGSSYFDPKETLTLVAGVGAVVAVLAFLAWGYPGIRFPLGCVLCVIGFIVYLLGWTALRQLVAEEGILKALMFRFCPPYQWWFVITRWDETRDFFAFFAAGAAIMAIGGGIIKTSEEGKRAEASDRAFQKMQRARPAEPAATPAPFDRDRD